MLLGLVGLFAATPVAAQTKTFSITERARAVEGTSVFLTITLSENAPGAGVTFTVAAGFSGSSTAEAVDVMSIDSPVTVPGGAKTLRIAIPLTDDDIDEDEETFTVTIDTTAEDWMKDGNGKDTAVVAIDDDDSAGVDLIGVNSREDMNQFPMRLNTPRTYRVVLASRPVEDVTIKASAGFRVAVSPESHTFAASSANDWRNPKEFTVTGVNMGATGISHTLISADPKYASLAGTAWNPSSRLQFYIDPPLPTRLTLRGDSMPAEGGGVVTVTATLDHPAPKGGVTVTLTPSGTATGGGVDYTLSSTTIGIAWGDTTGTITIRITDDGADDADETIVLDAASTNPTLTAKRLTLTITDNDGAPPRDPPPPDPPPPDPPPIDTQPKSSDADLSALTASAAASEAGAYKALDIGTFAGTAASYAATVPYSTTHVKLAPTVAHAAATVTVQGATVTSGQESGAIMLGPGANAITVRVTAENGTTKDYTVTITREEMPKSSNADLSALTASASESTYGPYSVLNIGTFAVATMSYVATVPYPTTRLKLTAMAAHAAATVTVDGATVTSGQESGPISLSEGANAITVRVTAQDGTNKEYTVTITRQGQGSVISDPVNISTRAVVGTGDEVMIGGFIIRNGPKRVLVQVQGPELANANIANALADPVLTVIDREGMELMTNDNWEDSQGQEVIDAWGGSPNLEAGSRSAAAILTLDPGKYTTVVRGNNDTAGVALFEVYDLDPAGAPGDLINISTCAMVGTNDEVMIGGFIIRNGPKMVLVQAQGPELADAGFANVLADPVLTIMDSEGMELAMNDNWGDGQGQEVIDTWGGSPNLAAGSPSAAIIVTLDPGSYTAIVSGKDGTTGVALVEVYDLERSLPDQE